ncbi:tetraspanin-1 [Leptinotarsa decemlineata]|uniref:tetraspanin-1 n=1 Tax=Leptinotarsa decemlineata TaxID=7539 RepID=UPI003D305774
MGTGTGLEGGLRRRMPLRRVGRGGLGGGASGLGGRAMRYYRLWIYTCNTALLAGAIAFGGAAARTVLFDYRRSLIPSLTLYQPSFLYVYLALATQGGALQLLGCMAALRLSEKLLNAYWLLLLVLLFGDVVLGAFWAFRFERICLELKPALRIRFHQEFGTDDDFTEVWNRLQTEHSCCGVTGPEDYNSSSLQLHLPVSCCLKPPPTANGTCEADHLHHSTGCDERLLSYLRATASLLAILGYCVLAFLKMCFLGILRYEIREMIQKIRILRTEMALTNVNGAVPGGGMRAESAESERESLLVRPECAALLSSPPNAQTKNPNGNNNYEMREYRSRENI